MKKVLIEKVDFPLLSIKRRHKVLWKSAITTVKLSYSLDNKGQDISPIMMNIMNKYRKEDQSYLIRYISCTKSIIDRLEKMLSTNTIKSHRYPVRRGLECLLAISDNLDSFYPIIEWWASSEIFDLFFISVHEIEHAYSLLLSDGSKNGSDVYYNLIKESDVAFRKSVDEEVLEILSPKYSYNEIKQEIRNIMKKLDVELVES